MSWKRIRLEDIADFSNGINFDKSAYVPGVKLIGVSDFKERFSPDYSGLCEVRSDIVRNTDYLVDGDIIFVRSNGNKELVGRCMLIKNPPVPITFSGFCIRARIYDFEKYDPTFFAYHFKYAGFRKAMAGTSTGTNIQNLSQKRLAAYSTLIPDIKTQRYIANILSHYDNLIENNQRQIKLLEEAAQRLYKEWFVDLHFPGYEITPVVDGVPEGWTIHLISDFGKIITGKTPPSSCPQYYGGNIPFVKIPDMHNTVFPIVTETHLTEEGAGIQKNKFLPRNSIMVSCIATVGLVNIAEKRCQTNQQINSIILNDETDIYFLYFMLKRMKVRKRQNSPHLARTQKK